MSQYTREGLTAHVEIDNKGRSVYYLTAFDGSYVMTDPAYSYEEFMERITQLRRGINKIVIWAASAASDGDVLSCLTRSDPSSP